MTAIRDIKPQERLSIDYGNDFYRYYQFLLPMSVNYRALNIGVPRIDNRHFGARTDSLVPVSSALLLIVSVVLLAVFAVLDTFI